MYRIKNFSFQKEKKIPLVKSMKKTIVLDVKFSVKVENKISEAKS